jgi:hypothetical protein
MPIWHLKKEEKQFMNSTFIILNFLVASLMLLSLCLSSPVAALESCTQLVLNRCKKCHYITRMCAKIDRERNKKSWFGSKGTWNQTITSMIKNGAQLNDEEGNILVECLSKPAAEILSLCGLEE